MTFRADLTRRLPHVPSVLNAVEGCRGLFVPTSTDDRWIYGRERFPDRGESIADWTPQRCTEVLRVGTGLPDLRPEIPTVMPYVMGWKLAWVLRGWAGETLLDSYQAERRPIGTDNVLRSLHRAPALPGDGLAWDIGVRYTSAVVEATTGTGTGERAPHAWMRRGGSWTSTRDLFDGRLMVLTGPRGGPWRRAVTEIAAEGLPIVALSVGRDLYDEDGAFARQYCLGDAGAALVRPDGDLAWRHSGPGGDARALLRSAVGLVLGRVAEVPALLRQAG